MKKTTKKATNFSFPVSKGALLPFDTTNLKFIAFFVVFFALLTIPATKILASTIFEDNFDSYITGALTNQGGWTCDYPNWSVNSTDSESAPYSIRDDATQNVSQCKKTGASTTEGAISFWFKTTNCGYGSVNRGSLFFYFTGAPYSQMPSVQITSRTDTGCEISLSNFSTEYVAMDTFDDWTQVILRWRVEINNYYYYQFGWGGNELSDWTQSIYQIGTFPTGFDRIQITGFYPVNSEKFYFDSIEEPSPEFLDAPIFAPSYPQDCQFSLVSSTTLSNFNAVGSVIIPSINPNLYFRFSVIAKNLNTGETPYFSTSTALLGGDVLNYSIPISLTEGAWEISYLLQGVYQGNPSFISHFCEGTGIGTAYPLPTWTEITEAEFLGIEDCSEYPLLERLVCDLKNAIKRIFVPSSESITALKTTIDGLKNKAPMNYISITRNFFDDVKNGINSSQDLTFKILNKTGIVSFAFWENTTNLAGENQTFSQIFKTFFIFLLIFSFLIWAIFYVRKIFK